VESDDRLKRVEERLAQAEWRLKAVQVAGMLLLLVLGIAWKYYDRSIGHAPFRVIDDKGNVLMNVDGSPDGTQTNLRLFPPGKDHVTVLFAHDGGGGLDLFDSGGRPLVGIGGGGPNRGIGINDREGKAAVWLGVNPEGSGLVLLRDGKQEAAVLGVTERGGHLQLYDRQGKPVASSP
jgi:hypothetical protein